MRLALVGLVVGVMVAGGGTAAAQPPAPDASSLLARCEAGAADDMQLATCQWVVETVLAPDPGASAAPYGADLPGLGVTIARGDETITLVDVEWAGKDAFGNRPDDKANRFIAIRVLYEATEDGASYNPLNWSLVDLEGFSWDRTAFGGKDPALDSSNDLPAGRKAQGWITFEAPKNVHTFEVVESQDGYARWLVTEP